MNKTVYPVFGGKSGVSVFERGCREGKDAFQSNSRRIL
jgi:hypothetical protein